MKKRIVVKVGTKVLSTDESKLDVVALKHLVEQIVAVKKSGNMVIVPISLGCESGSSLIYFFNE